MRRIIVVLGVCALAAASAALAASGGSAKTDRARGLTAHSHPWVLRGVGHADIAPNEGKPCFVAAADQGCSLTPCRGFVAGSIASVVVTGSADWVPIGPQCGSQRQQSQTLVHAGPLPLLKGALQRLPRLATRPR